MAISGTDAARRSLPWWAEAILGGLMLGVVFAIIILGAIATAHRRNEKDILQRELDNAHQRVRDLEIEVDDLRKMLNRDP